MHAYNRFYPCVHCIFPHFSCVHCTRCGFYAPARRKGAIRFAFVCLSVHPSVAYIANNLRTRRPSMPKFGTKVPHLWCDSCTSFNVKRSKVKVTRPINADTHRASYLPNGKAYELQTWYTDGRWRPASATGAMTSKVKVQGHKVTWSVWAVLAQCCTCVISDSVRTPTVHRPVCQPELCRSWNFLSASTTASQNYIVYHQWLHLTCQKNNATWMFIRIIPHARSSAFATTQICILQTLWLYKFYTCITCAFVPLNARAAAAHVGHSRVGYIDIRG